ncbi:MAG TPA: Hsp70 family protein [Planctomycetaceae bacterium]|nr:Hsp70 family protein [Planctomycetaceae bacterium]
MLTTHAVGIDLGTTYSCIAYLNEQGEPVSIPNQEGEISTPSVVMYDQGDEIVGTEALRNAIMHPAQVVQNAKRFIGDPKKHWTIDGKSYSPVDVSTSILRKLLHDAAQQIGPIDRAVITVPAQFSEAQRLATVEAGRRAGLAQVDIINEPVAAALCYVLGTEGLWFTELASEQRILVYDLGGGTFDLSLVSYTKDQVRVIASTGDLNLGGIDWNQRLLDAVASQFAKEFGDDPRRDPESLQHLSLEVEQCKRSLTVRPKAALIVQHAGHRKTYQIEREKFNALTQPLVRRTEEITRKLIDAHKRGAAHIDLTVLSAGGSSRMPMIDSMLANLKGTTVSKALSPDQSIAHGATYYAGMLLTNSEFIHSIVDPQAVARLSQMRQQSVCARDLGILVRDMKLNRRVPHYLLPANTPLPASVTKTFGTVIPNQKRVRLYIIESGAGADQEYAELGTCTIEGLPPNLPAESRIDVMISYDASACVQVSARDRKSGKAAKTEIRRGEVLPVAEEDDEAIVTLEPVSESSMIPVPLADVAKASAKPPVSAPTPSPQRPAAAKPAVPAASRPAPTKPAAAKSSARPPKPTIKPVPRIAPVPPPGPVAEPPRGGKSPPSKKRSGHSPTDSDPGAEEFWKLTGE